MIGEILEIQGFKIALPKEPKEVYSCSKKKEEQISVLISELSPSHIPPKLELKDAVMTFGYSSEPI